MRLAELASAPLCCGVLEAGEKAPLSTSIWCRLRCRSRTASFVPRHASGGEVASPPRCRSVSSDDCREQADVGSDADLRTRGVNAAAAEAASRAEPQPSGSDASAPATDGDTILRATALLSLSASRPGLFIACASSGRLGGQPQNISPAAAAARPLECPPSAPSQPKSTAQCTEPARTRARCSSLSRPSRESSTRSSARRYAARCHRSGLGFGLGFGLANACGAARTGSLVRLGALPRRSA